MSAEVALIQLEREVLRTASVGTFLQQVAALQVLVAMASPGLKDALYALVEPKVEATTAVAIRQAFDIGAADASRLILAGTTATALSSWDVAAPLGLGAGIGGLDAAATTSLLTAKQLATVGVDAAVYLAPVFGFADRLQRTVTREIIGGGNTGTVTIAAAENLPTVWIAERNACVVCLAYAGEVADPGKQFPGGLTYGKKSYFNFGVVVPPRHDRCRCTLEPLVSMDYAGALKREAQRSVLRGFSLQSESMAVRVDATDRLLKRKSLDAPKSVIAYAQAAVNRGYYTRRTPVPPKA
ncbi:MAG: hypothetical protein JWO98_5323 [Frankiales bacterium]|nr:hypothetical protein [Frankiales bacterium]